MKTLSMKLAAATMAGLALTGCVEPQPSPYEASQAETKTIPPQFKVETLAKGNFFEPLPDGIHKLTFPANVMGTEKNQECTIIKDAIGYRSYSVNLGCKDVAPTTAPAAAPAP